MDADNIAKDIASTAKRIFGICVNCAFATGGFIVGLLATWVI